MPDTKKGSWRALVAIVGLMAIIVAAGMLLGKKPVGYGDLREALIGKLRQEVIARHGEPSEIRRYVSKPGVTLFYPILAPQPRGGGFGKTAIDLDESGKVVAVYGVSKQWLDSTSYLPVETPESD